MFFRTGQAVCLYLKPYRAYLHADPYADGPELREFSRALKQAQVCQNRSRGSKVAASKPSHLWSFFIANKR